MVTRIVASLLALVMFATSGVIGGVAYLCLMDGQVHSECCCKGAQAEPDGDRAQLVRADDCCEVRVTQADHQPARIEATKHQAQPLHVLVPLPFVAQVHPPSAQDANLPPEARGPPSGSKPPLFVLNCSYLI